MNTLGLAVFGSKNWSAGSMKYPMLLSTLAITKQGSFKMQKRIKQVIIFLIVAITVLLVGGIIYQQLSITRDANNYPAPGELIEVGGHRLHLHCIGEGEPTLIIDAGAADWSLSWLTLQEDLSTLTRTCVYDRAGLGWSEAGEAPRTSDTLVRELHTLLANANIEPPYIFLGHSLGGYNARIYHEQYPDDLAGMILLESAHPDQWNQLPEEVEGLVNEQVGLLNTMSLLSNFGIVRLILPEHTHHSEDFQGIYRSHMATSGHMTASAYELGGGIESATQVPDNSLDDLPLVVVTAAKSFDAFRDFVDDFPFDESEEVWQALQLELAGLSTNSVHLISPDATHNIHFDDPEIVIEALEQMLSMLEG